MINLLCFLGHKWSQWTHVGGYKSNTILKRKCLRCHKEHPYMGMIETDISSGEKSPYTFKS